MQQNTLFSIFHTLQGRISNMATPLKGKDPLSSIERIFPIGNETKNFFMKKKWKSY